MDVLVLIDKLDDLVHNAKAVPLTDTVRVDKEEIYDILDQMRATIPEEIKQARWIVKERQEMLAEAKREAERIVKEARERQEQLVSQQEVTRQAERAAEDIIEDARAREREIRLGAEDYADEILNTLEVNLSKFIAAVQRGASACRAATSPPKSVNLTPMFGRKTVEGHAQVLEMSAHGDERRFALRRGRLARPQGPVQRNRRRRRDRSGALRQADRGLPRCLLEDPDVNDETRPILEPVRDRLTWDAPDPLDRRHRGAALGAEDGQHQAFAGRRPAGTLRHL